MATFDQAQEMRNEIAKLRQDNGDLGEKCGALLVYLGGAKSALIQICDTPTTQPLVLKQIALEAVAKIEEAKP